MSIIYGRLDVHMSSISVCLLHSGTGEIISRQLPNDQQHVLRAARGWAKLGEARLCYEASGAGFVLQRGGRRSPAQVRSLTAHEMSRGGGSTTPALRKYW